MSVTRIGSVLGALEEDSEPASANAAESEGIDGLPACFPASGYHLNYGLAMCF